jgi:hypothetical protein
MPAVIVENDESEWKDETGEIYHFPQRYLPILTPGQKVIYYRSRLRNPDYAAQRLSADPHYFGIAEIGQVYPDPESNKGDHFATIENFRPFITAVPARDTNGNSFEEIPSSRTSNYARGPAALLLHWETDPKIRIVVLVLVPSLTTPQKGNRPCPAVLAPVPARAQGAQPKSQLSRWIASFDRRGPGCEGATADLSPVEAAFFSWLLATGHVRWRQA